jgi:hypothetical protein
MTLRLHAPATEKNAAAYQDASEEHERARLRNGRDAAVRTERERTRTAARAKRLDERQRIRGNRPYTTSCGPAAGGGERPDCTNQRAGPEYRVRVVVIGTLTGTPACSVNRRAVSGDETWICGAEVDVTVSDYQGLPGASALAGCRE